MKLKLSLLVVVLMASGLPVRADDFGCTVLLCMANPAGPMAVAECVPPISQLYRDLARGKAFPSCQMASAPDAPSGRSWAEYGVSYYDACPAGTTALALGAYATLGSGSTYYLGIGEGDRNGVQDTVSQPSKTCVGNRIGDTTITAGEGSSGATLSAGVFDQVVVVGPNPQPNYVDVYVDSTFSHRVRW